MGLHMLLRSITRRSWYSTLVFGRKAENPVLLGNYCSEIYRFGDNIKMELKGNRELCRTVEKKERNFELHNN
jgi:hypothetical protein